jgi:hypothetical protein
VTHLFTSSPASLNVATATRLVFVTAGTIAVAGSLQQIYEKAFRQDHRGLRDLYHYSPTLPWPRTWVTPVAVGERATFAQLAGRAEEAAQLGEQALELGWLSASRTPSVASAPSAGRW